MKRRVGKLFKLKINEKPSSQNKYKTKVKELGPQRTSRSGRNITSAKRDFSKIDPGDLVPEEDSHDWTHIMVEGEKRNPELLKEFYQTTLKGYVCVRALNLCCFIFVVY
jgi:hypothetical protein